jgi:AcrR family transcriptional regulator
MESELAGQKRSGNPGSPAAAPAKSPAKRAYTLRQRRASMDETRARIVDAAVELYEEVGPAETTMSAVAARAHVTRATLYRHFPSETDVANVVIDEWGRGGPRIDAATLATIADPSTRLRSALIALYAGYRAKEGITANLLRDARALPEARRADLRAPAARARDILVGSGLPWRGVAPAEAAMDHALAFETWRSLAAGGLDDETIADLMVGLVDLAARFAARVAGRRRTAAPPAGRAAAPPAARVPTPAPSAGGRTLPTAAPVAPPSAPTLTPEGAPAAAALPADTARKAKAAGKGGAKGAGKGKGGKKGKGDHKGKGRDAGSG